MLKRHTDAFNKITEQLKKLGVEDAEMFFENPACYRGLAAEKSKRITEKYNRQQDQQDERKAKTKKEIDGVAQNLFYITFCK